MDMAVERADVDADPDANCKVLRHFGPRTLRTQDISALVPKCP